MKLCSFGFSMFWIMFKFFCGLYMYGSAHAKAHMWRSKCNLQESVFSFFHEDSGNLTQDVRFNVKCIPLSSQYCFGELLSQYCLQPMKSFVHKYAGKFSKHVSSAENTSPTTPESRTTRQQAQPISGKAHGFSGGQIEVH